MQWITDFLNQITENKTITQGLPTATYETLGMVLVSGVLTVLLGLPLGVFLYHISPQGLRPKPWLNQPVGLIVNIVRSIPFMILLILLIPVSRFIIGTSIGWQAVSIALTLGMVPFFARLVEAALREVAAGKVEAARVMGSTNWQIITKVLLPESISSIVAAITTSWIALVGYSAMAGALGGGGLGFMAISYGYRRFDGLVLFITLVIITLLVQLIQLIGDRVARRLDHRTS